MKLATFDTEEEYLEFNETMNKWEINNARKAKDFQINVFIWELQASARERRF